MKNFIVGVVLIVALATGLVVCLGKNNPDNNIGETSKIIKNTSKEEISTKSQDKSEAANDKKTTPQVIIQKETTPEKTTPKATNAGIENETTKSPYKSLSMNEILGLTNEAIPWGSGGGSDEDNIPNGSIYYNKLYGKYNADFVRTTKNKEKVIYLTTDEGYENGYTPKILDTLKEKNVHIVFFCTIDFIKNEPELVKRIINEGHILANHSCTHPSTGLPSESIEQEKKEFMDNHNYVKEHFNYEMKLFRYPCGIFSEQSLALAQSLGYTSVFWSYAYLDYDINNQPDVASSLKKAVDGLHPGAIYLLHAVSATNAAMMGDFIDQARAKGYTFERYY